MPEVLITQHRLAQVLGPSRLKRLLHAGWLAPAQSLPSRVSNRPSRVLYRIADVHAALRRLEAGERCPPDQIESARTNGSAVRHGRGYVRRERKARPTVWDLNLDFSNL
jgi:hypothetical protein